MTRHDFKSIEFGVCIVDQGEKRLFRIPIDNSVRDVLVEMYDEFYEEYNRQENPPAVFEPSEKYATSEKLTIEYNSEYVDALRRFFSKSIIPVATAPINELARSATFYFAIFHHKKKSQKSIAVKRPSQFKGLLKKKLIYLVDDTLKAVPDNIFKLDKDFDFIIQGQKVDILHPKGFIFIANIDEAILSSAANATLQLARTIHFVDFTYLSKFVATSKTAARLVSSIRSRDDLPRTSLKKLKQVCRQRGLSLREEQGKLAPEEKDIIRFLQILDRREYDVDLTEDDPEVYVASSRRKIEHTK